MEIPEPFATTLHSRNVDNLKKVREKNGKKNKEKNRTSAQVVPIRKKKDEDPPPDGKPTKD